MKKYLIGSIKVQIMRSKASLTIISIGLVIDCQAYTFQRLLILDIMKVGFGEPGCQLIQRHYRLILTRSLPDDVKARLKFPLWES